MPDILQKQQVDIVFSRGVETKTDPKVVEAGTLSILENYRFEGGTLKRRDGSVKIYSPGEDSDLVKPGYPTILGKLGDSLVARDENNIFSVSADAESLVRGGRKLRYGTYVDTPAPSMSLEKRRLYGRVKYPSQSSFGKLTLRTWLELVPGTSNYRHTMSVYDSDGTVLLPFFDTGQALYGYVGSAPVTTQNRTVQLSDGLGVFYIAPTGIVFRKVLASSPKTVGAEISVVTGDFRGLDVAKNPDGTFAVLTAEVVGSNYVIAIRKVTEAGVPGSATSLQTTALSTAVNSNGYTGLSVGVVSGGNIFCVWARGTVSGDRSVLYAACVKQDLTLVVAASIIGAQGGNPPNTIVPNWAYVGIGPGLDNDELYLAAGGSSTVDSVVYHGSLALSGSVILWNKEATSTLDGCRLLTRPFKVNPSTVYLGVSRKMHSYEDYGETKFIVDKNSQIAARFMYDAGETVAGPTSNQPVQVVVEGGKARFLASEYQGLGSEKTSILTEVALEMDDGEGLRMRPVQYGGVTIFPGAIPRIFDGQTLAELGFNHAPHFTATADTASGSLEAGAYRVAAVFKWTDAFGNVWESAPSFANVTLGATGRIAWRYTNMWLTDMIDAPVNIAFYRSLTNDVKGTLYRLPYTQINNPTSTGELGVLFYDDSSSNEYLATQEKLYTVGGAVEATAAPPCGHISVHDGRLVLSDTETGEVFFSNKYIKGYGPRFNEFFVFPPNEEGDKTVATESMDGRLIHLCEQSVRYSTGDGPNELGAGGFSPVQKISMETGCSDPPSVILSPDGVMFRGNKGVYTLRRDLSLVPSGAPAEKLTGRVISAVHVKDLQEIRFPQSNPDQTLVYSYAYGQWSTNTPRPVVSAVEHEGRVAWTEKPETSFSSIYKEVPGQESDNGQAIVARFRTSWFRFAGLQGFKRIWWINLLGTFRGASTITLRLGFDDEPDLYEAVRCETVDLGLAIGDPLEIRYMPERQACKAIRFEVECDGGGDDPSGGSDWTGITLELGVKRGLFRLSSLKSLGAPQGRAGL